MKIRQMILIGVATVFLALPIHCQTTPSPTNLTYFKTNLANNLTNLDAAMKAYRQGRISKEEITATTLATLNDQPITFYGKLEDQAGNPLNHATINFDVRVNSGFESTVKRGQVISDRNGLFTISGYHGESLGLMPHLEGYAPLAPNTYFKYSHLEQGYFVSDPFKPVVVKMWKIHGAEPLVKISKTFKLLFTNAPIRFDLVSGTIVSNGGDLEMTISRPPGIISGRNHQWWRVRFDVVDGGLMDSLDASTTYFAPENGYEATRTLSSTDRLPEGGIEGFHTGFYVKSRHGQIYSKLGVSFRINAQPEDLMTIRFDGVANTNSSRNWEGASGTYLNPGF